MIGADNLVKRFGPLVAVDGVSMAVDKGEVLGFLGPNGAGKSTTMRLLTGFLPADAGTVTIAGHCLEREPAKARAAIGYLPENAPAYGEMTVEGFLRFAAGVRGFPYRQARQAADAAIATCMLEPVRHQAIDTLSKGYAQRACFAQAIVHDPAVLILDEPTDGLDPNQKQLARELIRRMRPGKAIVLSTHILEEVDAVCTRVMVIDRGRVVADGTTRELRARLPHNGAVVVRIGAEASLDEIAAVLRAVPAMGTVSRLEEASGMSAWRCLPAGPEAGEALADRLVQVCLARGWRILELHPEQVPLDEVFRRLTIDREGSP